jgi:hypothetical protein
MLFTISSSALARNVSPSAWVAFSLSAQLRPQNHYKGLPDEGSTRKKSNQELAMEKEK